MPRLPGFAMAATCGIAIVLAALPIAAPAQGDVDQGAGSVIDDPKLRGLDEQDADPGKRLLDALRAAAERGPVFQISPSQVRLSLETGEAGRQVVRLSNTGDQTGEIRGLNAIGSFSQLQLSSACQDPIPAGDYCEIVVTYSAEVPRSIETTIVGTTNEQDRTSFEIPVRISVEAPPPEPDPDPDPEPEPEPVVQEPPEDPAPTSRDIARRYLGAVGGYARRSRRGFTIVSADPDPAESATVGGVAYEDIETQEVRTQERYAADIPHTEASLPVDRDRILTTDRVIKAVLETPVSNVMCNKTVAMVESDVYGATSRRPLIRAGSKIVGRCQEFVGERAGIAWNRIITTTGRSITFDTTSADTADAAGVGGAPGRLYKSAFDTYVLPIFSTMIDTAAGVIQATFGEDEKVVTDENGNIVRERSAENRGTKLITDEARGSAQQIIRDIRDVREVVVVPKGTRIDVMINEDIYFESKRRIVRLGNQRFDVEAPEDARALRGGPEALSLVPASDAAEAAITIDGQAYRVEQRAAPESDDSAAPSQAEQGRIRPSQQTRATIEDIRSGTSGRPAGPGPGSSGPPPASAPGASRGS